MLKLKERAKYYMSKDYFRIGAAGLPKVRKTNKLALIGGGTFSVIILFYIILYITTNYYMLNDFEDYINDFKKGKEISKFEKINVGIKIMPSYNLEDNVLYMTRSREVSHNKTYNFLNFEYIAI